MSTLNVFLRREAVVFYLYEEGTMPEALWQSRMASLTGVLNQPGLKLYLATAAETLPKDFRAFIEQHATMETTMSEGAKEIFVHAPR